MPRVRNKKKQKTHLAPREDERGLWIHHSVIDCPAFDALRPPAAKLLLLLLREASGKMKTTGFMAARKAAERVGCNKNTVATLYGELEHYGFLSLQQGHRLGPEGIGAAATWWLNMLPRSSQSEGATEAYLRWDGEVFDVGEWRRRTGHYCRSKKQNPVPPFHTKDPRQTGLHSIQRYRYIFR